MRELQSYHNLIYIFLDVDGVLNDENYIVKCYEKHHKAMHMNHLILNV